MIAVNLTYEEQEIVQRNEKSVADTLSVLNTYCNKFKIGDFLIAFKRKNAFAPDAKAEIVKNSYGAVRKFQVVYIDKVGLPYIKEVSKKGVPAGVMMSTVQSDHYGGFRFGPYMFEIDPEYADSLILQDDGFNPSEILKERSDAFKEIAKYNKSVKIPNTETDIIAYIKTLKVGDIIWRTHTNSWIVTKVEPIPKKFMRNATNYSTKFITVKQMNGEEKEMGIWDFNNISIYKDRPRSYRELKDPKL